MIGLDTNVLLRFLVEDDAQQSAKARQLLQRARREEADLYVPKVVLCELIWVLDRGYRLTRPRQIEILTALLRTQTLVFEDRDQVRAAVDSWARGKADFADYLIVEECVDAGCIRVASFDSTLAADPRVFSPTA